MAKLQDRAKDRASDVRPYIERAFKDERVREDVKSAVMTARETHDIPLRVIDGREAPAPHAPRTPGLSPERAGSGVA